MAISLSAALGREYERLFESCDIRPGQRALVERVCQRLVRDRSRYEAVTARQGVPWAFVAAVHQLESGGDFRRHLHNGDPLSGRTVRVPAGRPKRGSPPFSWEESAADALALKRLGGRTDWSLAGLLYQLERYNGWGYRRYHPHVLSPYLWSGSVHYERGKYVADGRWSETAVSKQIGAAVLLRRLAELGEIALGEAPPPSRPAEAEADRVEAVDTLAAEVARGAASPPLVSRHAMRPGRAPEARKAEHLQRWLNTFPGLFLRVDGIPGDRTSTAYRRVTGHYLPGDSRGSRR
ncbi:hypothetical protein ACFQH5_18075 [Halomonas salifodinae]|uniref:Lysozyme family protein n=1 Tax=Halomonas salifodinae TaxID=438745 RepID=A0ABW2EZP1_9GAMM